MRFEDNTLLFGFDPTPRIVAIEMGDIGTVRVYRREKNGSTICETEEFHPFVWADGDVADLGLTNADKLTGNLKYNWLVTTNSWKELIALRNGLKSAGRSFFALSDPVQHYLTHTGRTLFKQLPFEELKRMQIEVLSFAGGDLETTGDDHITSIALADNSGWEELIEVNPNAIEESEHAAIKRLTTLIKERDPDVIEGHNLFKFDLPFLVARARKAKTKLDWGRERRFSALAPVAPPNRRENDRLPKIHHRWATFRRHFSARSFLRCRDALALRLRAKRRCAALWPNKRAGSLPTGRKGIATRLERRSYSLSRTCALRRARDPGGR